MYYQMIFVNTDNDEPTVTNVRTFTDLDEFTKEATIVMEDDAMTGDVLFFINPKPTTPDQDAIKAY